MSSISEASAEVAVGIAAAAKATGAAILVKVGASASAVALEVISSRRFDLERDLALSVLSASGTVFTTELLMASDLEIGTILPSRTALSSLSFRKTSCALSKAFRSLLFKSSDCMLLEPKIDSGR